MRRRFFSFFRKSLRLIPWLIGILCILWASGYLFVRPIARHAIGELTGGAVHVESGRFKGLTGIRLKGVLIAESVEGLTNGPILQFDEIDLMVDPWKLLRGKLEVHTIRLSHFLVDAVYAEGQWNFLSLIEPRDVSAETPGILPLIELDKGALRISRMQAGRRAVITTVSLNGQAAIQSGQRDYSFFLVTDGRFGFGESSLVGSLKIGQAGEKSRFVVEGNIQMPEARIFENAWDMEQIRLICEFDRQEVRVERGEFAMGPAQVFTRGAISRNADNRWELDADVNIEQLTISDRFQRNAVIYSEPVLDLLDEKVQQFSARFHPRGTGDVRLTFKGLLDDLSKTEIHGTVTSRDISVLDETFPYRLDHLQGSATLTGRDLTINQLMAEHGEVDLAIAGSIRNFGPSARYDISTTSSNMQLDEDLYQALTPSLKQVWYSFTPKGTAGINLHYKSDEAGISDVTLAVELKGTGLVYEHFPYPLENMTGKAELKREHVKLLDIVSHYDDSRQVTLNGEVLGLETPQPEYNIQIEAEEIPVDELLIDAMPPGLQAFFDEVKLDAVADIDVSIFPDAAQQHGWGYMADIRADGKHMEYTGFPLPMEDVHLNAVVSQEAVALKEFSGTTSGGQITMKGDLLPSGVIEDRPGICLELGLENFDFNDTFWTAAGETADRMLGKLRLRGPMNVKGHIALNLPEASCVPTDLRITCADNPVLYDNKPVGRASGQLHLKRELVAFEGFQLKGLRLESIPAELLEGSLKEAYISIEPQGEADLQIDGGTLRMGESGPEQIDVRGSVFLDNAAAGHEQAVNGIVGVITGQLQFDRTANTWQALTMFKLDHFNYHDWYVSDFHGNIVYDPNTKLLEGNRLVADFYGGKLVSDIDVDLSGLETLGYKLGITLNDVDVPQLLAADTQDTLTRVGQGLAFGALTLEGDLKAMSESSGKMTVTVKDMQLGQQSLPGKILTAVQFKQPDEYIFSEVQAEAYIRPQEIIIETVRMVGKPLVFRGKGKVDLQQKTIEMDWVGYDRLLGSEDTILDLLARGIGSAIWKVEVRGDVKEPQVNAVFLSVLKQPLDIFEKKP